MANAYQYRPLAPLEIRILVIDRVTDSEAVCSLRHVKLPTGLDGRQLAPRLRLGKRPWYDALSYTWGSSGTSRSITVDGKSMPVTENLWLALRKLRTVRALLPWRFWIDAICINQLDVPERNAQVQRMADIYANGNRTVVWLGEATECFALVNKCIKHLFYWILGRRFLLRRMGSNGIEEIMVANNNETRAELDKFFRRWQRLYDKKRALWPAVSNFLKRPWFRRLWVIQEVVLAAKIRLQVGEYFLGGYTFSVALKGFFVHVESHPSLLSDPEARSALRAVEFVSHTAVLRFLSFPWHPSFWAFKKLESPAKTAERLYDQQLEVLIGRTLSTKATDLRDRVFALLSLAFFREGHRFVVDYSLKTHEEVYIKLMRFCLEDLKSPSILSLAGMEIHGREWSLALPSWIPDLSQPSTHGMAPQSMADKNRFSCATKMKFSSRILNDSILVVKTAILTSVRWVIPSPQDEIPILDAWFRECDALETKCQSIHLAGKKSFNTACWRTMVWDQGTPDVSHIMASWAFVRPRSMLKHRPCQDMGYSSYRAYRKICQAAADGHGAVDESTIKTAYEFRARFHSIGYGTRKAMMVTESGRLVSGPAATRAGDKICIIAGAKVPFILRRTDGDEGYRLVGECFVYGLMGGEVSRVAELEFYDVELR
ncbi:hypothetical protein MMC28_006358 [Mycoblastus sanguinarius]|nr:hypothetical protein [Mycoblastus sanguinarius]